VLDVPGVEDLWVGTMAASWAGPACLLPAPHCEKGCHTSPGGLGGAFGEVALQRKLNQELGGWEEKGPCKRTITQRYAHSTLSAMPKN
jgi:hypothetical protein